MRLSTIDRQGAGNQKTVTRAAEQQIKQLLSKERYKILIRPIDQQHTNRHSQISENVVGLTEWG